MRWLDGVTEAMDMNLGKLGDGEGQEGLVCCSPWVHKESDTTEQRSTCMLFRSLFQLLLDVQCLLYILFL